MLYQRFAFFLTTIFLIQAQAILGGEPVFINNPIAPFIARFVTENSKTFCTGIFLHPRIVLTAAHCKNIFDGTNVSLRGDMYVGGDSYSSFGRKVRVQEFIIHEDFQTNSDFDVAIAFLAEPKITYKPNILIWNKATDILTEKLMLYGFGRFNPGEENGQKEILRSVEKRILRDDKNLLYFDQTDKKGVCYGDSGGPAIIKKDNLLYIVGIHHQVSPGFQSQDVRNCYQESTLVKAEVISDWVQKTLHRLLNNLK